MVRKVQRRYSLYLKINRRYAIRLWWTDNELNHRWLFTLAEWEAVLLMDTWEHLRIVEWKVRR